MSGPLAARIPHAAAMAAIHAGAFPAAEAWGADAFAAQLALPGVFGFLDRRGGMVLARAAGGEGEILTLGVDPAARRRGLARFLVAAALAEAAARGAASMFLEVAADNAAAIALYAGLGFAPVGRRPGYYGAGRDAVVMRRDGGDHSLSGAKASSANKCVGTPTKMPIKTKP